jgi:hypothetical protein
MFGHSFVNLRIGSSLSNTVGYFIGFTNLGVEEHIIGKLFEYDVAFEMRATLLYFVYEQCGLYF